MSRPPSRRSWIAPTVLGAGLLGLVWCGWGYAMAASLAGAHPARVAHWRQIATAYLVGAGVAVLAIAVGAALTWHRLRRAP
jgi:hypothetical protein